MRELLRVLDLMLAPLRPGERIAVNYPPPDGDLVYVEVGRYGRFAYGPAFFELLDKVRTSNLTG